MKCSQKGCDGDLRAKSGYIAKRTGCYTRTRVCNKCGYKIQTMEVNKETYIKNSDLADGLQKLVNAYMASDEQGVKNV